MPTVTHFSISSRILPASIKLDPNYQLTLVFTFIIKEEFRPYFDSVHLQAFSTLRFQITRRMHLGGCHKYSVNFIHIGGQER